VYPVSLESSYRGARDVGQVGSDTGGVHDIVEGELGDELAGLEEERQWLRGVSGYNEAVLQAGVPVQFLQRHRQQLL
jgi:hypothetical protein